MFRFCYPFRGGGGVFANLDGIEGVGARMYEIGLEIMKPPILVDTSSFKSFMVFFFYYLGEIIIYIYI